MQSYCDIDAKKDKEISHKYNLTTSAIVFDKQNEITG